MFSMNVQQNMTKFDAYSSKCTPPNTIGDSNTNLYLFKPNLAWPMESKKMLTVDKNSISKRVQHFSVVCQFSKMCYRPLFTNIQGLTRCLFSLLRLFRSITSLQRNKFLPMGRFELRISGTTTVYVHASFNEQNHRPVMY